MVYENNIWYLLQLGCGRIYSANHNAGHWASDSCSIKLGYICATSKSKYRIFGFLSEDILKISAM